LDAFYFAGPTKKKHLDGSENANRLKETKTNDSTDSSSKESENGMVFEIA